VKDQYLWDGTGEPDSEIVEFERALASFRYDQRPIALPDVSMGKRGRGHWNLRLAFAAIAIASFFIGTVVFFAVRHHRHTWELTVQVGHPEINGVVYDKAMVAIGQSIRTDHISEAKLYLANVGTLQLYGDSDMSLVESRASRQRVFLRYGNVHAAIDAPPSVFIVDTPAARAIDLGCEYDLTIDPDGNGTLKVTAGWVQLVFSDRQSLVPQGASARIAHGGLLSPPYFDDASPEFKELLIQFSTDQDHTEAERMAKLQQILAHARKKDSYTLIHLLRDATDRDERLILFERLSELIPPTPGLARETIADATPLELEPWWKKIHDALGLSAIRKKGSRMPALPYLGTETR
jgi:hypothetical protein